MSNETNSKFRYQFDSDTKILYKNYFGAISIEDIEDSWEYAFDNKLIPDQIKGFILDYRKATFNVHIDESKNISNFYLKHINYFKGHKIAIITDKPQDVVIPIMVSYDDQGYFSKPFYSLEGALNWILN